MEILPPRAMLIAPSTDPPPFVQTNIVGTYTLLEAARDHFIRMPDARREQLRFLHVSTDEVYGSLGRDRSFSLKRRRTIPVRPTRRRRQHRIIWCSAWGHSFALPILIANCSNNYGPYQFPEKLIPLCIIKALGGEPLPIYGTGENVRDWLPCRGPRTCAAAGSRAGPAGSENIQHRRRCRAAEHRRRPKHRETFSIVFARKVAKSSYRDLIQFVSDRPGHDLRYAIDATKSDGSSAGGLLQTLETGLEATVRWYLDEFGLVATDPAVPIRWLTTEHHERTAGITAMKLLMIGGSGQVGIELRRLTWPTEESSFTLPTARRSTLPTLQAGRAYSRQCALRRRDQCGRLH